MFKIALHVLSKVSTVPNVSLDTTCTLLEISFRGVTALIVVHSMPIVSFVNILQVSQNALAARMAIRGEKIVLAILPARKIALQVLCGEKKKMIARNVLLSLKVVQIVSKKLFIAKNAKMIDF